MQTYCMWPWILINGQQQLMETIKLAANKICPAHKAVYILQGVTNKDLHEAAGGDKTQWMCLWLCSSAAPSVVPTWSTTWHNGKRLHGATTMMAANVSQNNPAKPWPIQYLAPRLRCDCYSFERKIVQVCERVCVAVHQGKPCYELDQDVRTYQPMRHTPLCVSVFVRVVIQNTVN